MEHSQNNVGNQANTPANESDPGAAIEAVKEIMRKMIKAELEHPSYDPKNCEACRKEGRRTLS